MNYMDLLSPGIRRKPCFAALAAAVLAQADDLFALLESVNTAFHPDTAAGAQLDALGALCGIPRPRPDTPDADYRLLLRAGIAACHWDGTNGTVPEWLAFVFPDRMAVLEDNQDGTVTVSLTGEAPPFAPETLFPHPAGVRLTE